MVLYGIYRKNTPVKDQKLPEHKGNIINGENMTNTTLSDENQKEFVEIEIGEKKEKEEKPVHGTEEKKQDQTENNIGNKTREGNNQLQQKEG